jgi:hypothetical protein
MVGSDEDLDRNRRSGVEDRGWSSTDQILDGQAIRRLGDSEYGMYHAKENEEHEFLG